KHQSHHGLGNHAGSGDSADIRALVDAGCSFTACHIHGLQRTWHRGSRLHGRAHAQLLAIGHATFEPAGAVAQAVHAIIGAHHFIMSFGTWTTCFFKAIADFYALDRLDTH